MADLDEHASTDVDLVKRIHELTARLADEIIEHRGLSHFVIEQHRSYKQFYEEQDQ